MIDTLLLEASPGELRGALLAAGQVWQVEHERRWPEPDGTEIAGAVFCGRVRRIDPGMNAAFVDLGAGADGFLRARDALGSDGQRDRGGRIQRLVQEGALVPVQIVGSARGDKGPVVSMAALREDLAGLSQRCQAMAVPALLTPGPDLVLRLLTTYYRPDSVRLVTNDRGVAKALEAGLSALGLSGDIALEAPGDIAQAGGLFESYGIEAAITTALDRRVALPGGGRLIFDEAEALTVIDVDSGRHAGRPGRGACDVNVAAAPEIARQLRLRNIGGVVVIDALKLDRKADREVFLKALQSALVADPAGVRVHGMTTLGLVELTRPQRGTTLAARLLEGRGERPVRADAVAYDALRSLQRMAAMRPGAAVRLRAAAAVIAALEGGLNKAVGAVETAAGVRITLTAEAGWPRGRVEFEEMAR